MEAISLILRDVSERIGVQRQLDMERDAFLATLSHDLKTPLTVIVGYARLLARRITAPNAPSWLPRAVDQVEASARRSLGMLDDLLDLAHRRMGEAIELDRQPTDLVALVRDAVAAHQSGTPNHRIEMTADSDELVGIWDRQRLERVLDNLLGNSVKYSPSGGLIVVAVRRDGSNARLVVRDRGIGIPPADLALVFDRFARGSNASGFSGTGIGLSSVRDLVDAHGGEVEIDSQVGVGTTVAVRLPIDYRAKPPSSPAA